MLRIRILIFLLCFSVIAEAQDVEKKSFCKDLNKVVITFSQSNDSLKGKFIGENSLGIQQWDAKYSLPGAISKVYERNLLETSEEYRATYVIIENARYKDVESYYKQIVQAVRWCYNSDYTLNELVTTEWDHNGNKHQHHEATFTFSGIAENGIIPPFILVRSFAIASGLFAVTVEIYSMTNY